MVGVCDGVQPTLTERDREAGCPANKSMCCGLERLKPILSPAPSPNSFEESRVSNIAMNHLTVETEDTFASLLSLQLTMMLRVSKQREIEKVRGEREFEGDEEITGEREAEFFFFCYGGI
ncbi:uncharacterized protein LOC21411858 [Morus notabilis]|uniref:uncharacterized protein LOC21411858 n=1 Tax=Morus notabilis TaxID=981085 RepID=UPI000CED1B89|nr:uncharacterized protein LOC21411858 [Morus notabilis]